MEQFTEVNKTMVEQAPIVLALKENGHEGSRIPIERPRKVKATRRRKAAAIKARLSGTHKKMMQELADSRLVSLSTVVRWAIIEYLERNCPGGN